MTQVIWKSLMPASGSFDLLLPEGAEIVSANASPGDPRLWFICDPKAPKVRRSFRLYDTGEELDDGYVLITVVINGDGNHVKHLFERVTG